MPNVWAAALRGIYLALIALQIVWHALLPPPHGAGRWLLGLVATVPLLLPLRGVIRCSLRGITWAGYLLLLYLVIGAMEAWSNPAQRLPALLQTALVMAFLVSALAYSRESN